MRVQAPQRVQVKEPRSRARFFRNLAIGLLLTVVIRKLAAKGSTIQKRVIEEADLDLTCELVLPSVDYVGHSANDYRRSRNVKGGWWSAG